MPSSLGSPSSSSATTATTEATTPSTITSTTTMGGVEEQQQQLQQQNKQVVEKNDDDTDSEDNDSSVLVLKLRGHKMKNVDGFLGRRDTGFSLVQTVDNWFGKSDPFFQVSNARYRRVQQSPVVHDNLNPDWPTLAIPLDFLLLGNTHDPDHNQQQFFITFYDWEEDGHHQFMGHVATTVQELLQHASHSDHNNNNNNNKKRHGFLRSSGRTKKQEPAFQLQVDGIHYGSIFVDEARVVSQKDQQQQQQPTNADRSMNDFIDITNVKVMKDGKQVQYTHEEIFQQEIVGSNTDDAAVAPTNEIASRSINLTTTTTPENDDDGVAAATAEEESSNRDTDAPQSKTTNAETSTKDLADKEKEAAITEPVTEPAPLVASPSDEELLKSNEQEAAMTTDRDLVLPEGVPFASNEQANRKGPPVFDMDLVVDNDDSPIKLQRGMTNANEFGVSTRAVIGADEAQSLTATDDNDDKLDAPLEANDSKEIEIEFGAVAEEEDAVRNAEDVLLDGLLSDDADDDLVFENDDPDLAPAQSLIFATTASPSKKETPPLPKKPVPDYVAKFKGVTLDSVGSGDLEPEEEEPELLQDQEEEEEEEQPMAPDALVKGSIEPTMDEEESSKPSEEPVTELETSKPPEDVATTEEETTKPFEETSIEEETTKPLEETPIEEEASKPPEEAVIEKEISKPFEEPAVEKEISKPPEEAAIEKEASKPPEEAAIENQTIKPAEDSPTKEEPAVVDTPMEQKSSKLAEDTTTTTEAPPSKPMAKPAKDPLSSSTRSTRPSKMESLASSTRSTGRSMLGSAASSASRATTRTSRIPKTSTTATTKKKKKETTESSSDKTNPSRRAAMEKSLSVPRIPGAKPAAAPKKKTRVTPTRSNSSSRLGSSPSVVQNRPRVVRPSDGSNVFERLYRKDTACYNARRVNKEYFTAQQN